MATRINPDWLNRHVENFTSMRNGFYQVLTADTRAVKALCLKLAEQQIEYAVVNMPGGVKKVTNQVSVCKKCGGTGKC